MHGLSDTSPEAEKVLRRALLEMPFSRRWRQMGELYHLGQILHAAGYRDRHPGATPEEIAADFRQSVAGRDLPHIKEARMASAEESLGVLTEVIAVLERLNIVYALGGSWASSLHGERRFTHDADLSVQPFPSQEKALVGSFGPDYYVSLQAVEEAMRRRGSFNIIHLPTSFKVGLFVHKDRAFEQTALSRRRAHRYEDNAGPSVYVLTPEDIILYKLEWFRLGGEVSERQWNDILGVFKTQAERLDQPYLDQWGHQLGVADLLARARQESGL
jgi:hypothetical protein